MAEAAVALLGDAEARHRAGVAARARVIRDFSWERSAAAVEALWSEVAAPAAAHGP
jgi:glycosyltransferase involved in cell wall biosynthesis